MTWTYERFGETEQVFKERYRVLTQGFKVVNTALVENELNPAAMRGLFYISIFELLLDIIDGTHWHFVDCKERQISTDTVTEFYIDVLVTRVDGHMYAAR